MELLLLRHRQHGRDAHVTLDPRSFPLRAGATAWSTKPWKAHEHQHAFDCRAYHGLEYQAVAPGDVYLLILFKITSTCRAVAPCWLRTTSRERFPIDVAAD